MTFRPLILLPLAVFALFAYLAYQGMQKGDQPLPSMMEGHEAAPVRVPPWERVIPSRMPICAHRG